MQKEGRMYYYAVLDDKNIVINTTSSQTALTGTNLITITVEQYNDPDNIIGMYYDTDTNSFIIPPISVLAEMSSSNIQYKAENKWLDTKLDEIEESIENIELIPGPQGPQGIQGEKGDKGDKGDTGATGATGSTGATGESGATFTPSVSSEGVISWTNNKGLTNPTSVNIKGPKGDTGATGPQGPAGTNAASAFEGYEPSQFATSGHNHHKFTNTSSITTYKAVYVSPLGSDNNDGLSQSKPMKTIKAAIRKYAEPYKMIDIKLADGTYTEDIGAIAVDCCNIAIRSLSEDKNNVLINMTTTLESNINLLRLYNVTLKVTNTDSRVLSITGGNLYAYNVKLEVPTASEFSCLNVYNGATSFIMNSIINSGTDSASGAAIYGNQALLIKAINCTSERKVTIAFHAHNGSDIYYTNTLNATTVKKETSYGKCTAR